MSKIYAPKPSRGTIELSFEGKTQKEKEEIKCLYLISKCKDKKFSLRGIDVEIIDGPKYVNDLLEVSVRSFRGGKELPQNNPMYYQNPPIKVPNGTLHKEDNIDVLNFKEDPEAALKEIIVQTIELLNT